MTGHDHSEPSRDGHHTRQAWRYALAGSGLGVIGASVLWLVGEDRAALVSLILAGCGVVGALFSVSPQFTRRIGGYTLAAAVFLVAGVSMTVVGALGLAGLLQSSPAMDVLSIVGGLAGASFGAYGLVFLWRESRQD